MLEWISYIQKLLPMPSVILIAIVIFFFVLQAIGEVLEVFGKAVPEIMKIRKYLARKKREREMFAEMAETLKKTNALLKDVSIHYNEDNIAKRDGWIKSVDRRLNESENHWKEFSEKLDKNNSVTLSLLIESKRSWLLSFACKASDENAKITREEYRRFFKTYKEYEKILEENDMTNGEVDIAHRLVVESYENRMHQHSFLENILGYEE